MGLFGLKNLNDEIYIIWKVRKEAGTTLKYSPSCNSTCLLIWKNLHQFR